MATKPVVTPATPAKELREVKTSIAQDQDVLIVNDSTTALLDKAFVMQDNFDNESKFRRAFTYDAVRAHVKAECNRIIAAWDAAIAKTSKLHPTNDRNANIALLLESKKGQAAYEMVKVALGLKQELA